MWYTRNVDFYAINNIPFGTKCTETSYVDETAAIQNTDDEDTSKQNTVQAKWQHQPITPSKMKKNMQQIILIHF